MIIAIPSDDGINIAQHSGCARGFLIYEIWDMRAILLEFRKNTNQCNQKSLRSFQEQICTGDERDNQWISKIFHDCDVLLAIGVGVKLIKQLMQFGVESIFCRETNAGKTAVMFARGELPIFDNSSCEKENAKIPPVYQDKYFDIERVNARLSRN